MAAICNVCGSRFVEVTHTEDLSGVWRGKAVTKVRRRRKCNHCLNVFYTVENLEPEEPQPDVSLPPESSVPEPGKEEKKYSNLKNPYL